MPATNGTLTPPSLPQAPAATSPSLAKRKRTETDAHVANGASPAANSTSIANGATPSLQTALADIHAVLKGYDTQPSILAHSLSTSATRAASGEADAKRAKLTPPEGDISISNLIQTGVYGSFEELEADVDTATADILASAGVGDSASAPASLEDVRLQSGVLAFRKMLKNLITREGVRRAHVESHKHVSEPTSETDPDSQSKETTSAKDDFPEGRTVLTLFGNHSGLKPVFSSLQRPSSVVPQTGSASLDMSVKVTLPLRESTLPNFISTTEVFPAPDSANEKKDENATIGKVFKAPAHLPQLSPPKLVKPLNSKGNIVTFARPETPKPNRKVSLSYTNQNLSTSYWLGYGGTDMPKDLTSPTEKKKSRQRALSMGEAQQPPPETTLVALKHAKEDALFRSAYSSFAPSRDDASAIVPEETKNMVWWHKVGEKRFNEVFPVDPELLELEGSLGDVVITRDAGEEEAFREAVENFEPIEGDPFPEQLDKGTKEVLQDISELLETLASHQRIRNSSLATNPRTPVIQNSSLASLAGSPLTPSSEEIDVYQMLKSQLTVMISQLPPYAVAKLNGEQLEELNISRTVIVENKDTRGVLEDDRTSKAPLSTPAPPTLSRMASGGSAHYPNTSQFGRSTPSMHSTARQVQNPQSYYPQQQPTVHRSPSVHYQRSSSGSAPAYQAPSTPFASTPRQSFPATQAYGQQTPRAGFVQPPSTQYFGQRPPQGSAYGGAAASQYYGGSTPHPQTQNRYTQQTPNGYYPRSQNVAPMYAATPTAHTRTASPLKSATGGTQSTFNSRPGYASGGQLRSTYYPPSQYGNAQPHTPVAPVTPGFPGASTQQVMLDRQQASQAQARLAAQNGFNRQGSGTPQPPPNGQFHGQPNGASVSI